MNSMIKKKHHHIFSMSHRFQDNLKKTLEKPIDALLGSDAINRGLDLRLERVLYDRVSNSLDNELDALPRRST